MGTNKKKINFQVEVDIECDTNIQYSDIINGLTITVNYQYSGDGNIKFVNNTLTLNSIEDVTKKVN